MLKKLILVVFCFVCTFAYAEEQDVIDEIAQDEALFDELFSDYDSSEKDITKAVDFDDAISKTADAIKKSGATKPLPVELEPKEEEPELPAIDGDIFVGIVNGSFNISKDMFGRPACTFSVMLRSELNRTIKQLAFYLVYKYTSFAFVFSNVEQNSTHENFIRTSGDICYHLNDLPDIEVNRCLIYAASKKECAPRMKWDTGMVSTDTSEERAYRLYL